jgi:hypothetical protein
MKLKYGGEINGMRILSPGEKQKLSKDCFKAANIDVLSLKGKNCKYESSNSSNTAYYRCDEYESAIGECMTKKPKILHVKKTYAQLTKEIELYNKKVENEERKKVFECFQLAKVNPLILKEENCTIRNSVSSFTTYYRCGEHETAVTGCNGSRPEIYYEKKSLSQLELESSPGYGRFEECLSMVFNNDVKISECSEFGEAFRQGREFSVSAICGQHKVIIAKCGSAKKDGTQPILSKTLISSKPRKGIVDSLRGFVKDKFNPKTKEQDIGASKQ